MKFTSPSTERIHSLDSLRAIMMLLGLLLHSGMTYIVLQHEVWPIKDPNATHPFIDYLVFYIHSFRMQIFFLVAGFFGAMLFYERGVSKMIKNRLTRITLPFVVFLFLVWPFLVGGFKFSGMVFAGKENTLSETLVLFSNFSTYIPSSTLHLWFLYNLTYMTTVAILLVLGLRKFPSITSKMTAVFEWVVQQPILRVGIFAIFTTFLYFVMGQAEVRGVVKLIPNPLGTTYYFYFYIVGWFFYRAKHLLYQMMRLDWVCTVLGMGLYTLAFLMPDSYSESITFINQALVVWFSVFGITGLFLRYASDYSPIMRYISDSSYWVYLIHLPITIIVPGLIANWSLPPLVKFMTCTLITVLICLLTYHLLVRSTFIGKFLNGRKYSLKFSDLKH